MASTGIDNGRFSEKEIPPATRRYSETVIAHGVYDESSPETKAFTPRASSSHDSELKPVFDYTHRKLKPRHIQLIGIGGTIGTALYVQIGRGLINGGPASLFIAFTLW